jgi:hypothetical protein
MMGRLARAGATPFVRHNLLASGAVVPAIPPHPASVSHILHGMSAMHNRYMTPPARHAGRCGTAAVLSSLGSGPGDLAMAHLYHPPIP